MSYALKQVSDKTLMTEYGLGDQQAFTELVRRYQSSLSSFLRTFMKRQDLVEDVFQETLLRVYTHRNRFDHQRPVKSWLFTIAANTARDTLRKSKRCREFSMEILNATEETSFTETLDRFAAYEDDPVETLKKREASKRILEVIEQLAPHKRDVELSLLRRQFFTA